MMCFRRDRAQRCVYGELNLHGYARRRTLNSTTVIGETRPAAANTSTGMLTTPVVRPLSPDAIADIQSRVHRLENQGGHDSHFIGNMPHQQRAGNQVPATGRRYRSW